jgi:hypothetical protein
MPFRYIKTTPASFQSSRSVQFNGTNQYLSIANNAAFNLSGAFTMECWIYFTSTPTLNASSVPGVTMARYGITGNTNQGWEFGINFDGSISIGKTGSGNKFGANCSAFSLNTWYHIAAVYNGSAGTIYLNGTALTSTNNTWSWTAPSGGTPLMTIGALLLYAGYNNYFPGYISNFRVVKGTALYTSSFTVPTAPLTAIANTSLLTCNAATIVDASSNNFTITNNGAATVSSTVPFTAATAVSTIKFINRSNAPITAATGNSVQFNGTNQYLSVARNAVFDLSTNNFTAEAWVYLTNSNAQQTIMGQWSGVTGGTTLSWIILTSNDANRYARFLISNNGSGVIGDYISNNAIPLNTWSHLALVRNGSAFNLYLNGISVTSTSTSVSVYYGTNTITIGATSNPSQFLGGYISNARIINGTALYTASFTAPTAPLTAIANTSLLTCNAATIVDSSTNNFTINGSATVSSVVPFNVVGYGFKFNNVNNAASVLPAPSGMNFKKVYPDPVISYMVATGGDLVTTSGSYKIHQFTTVGTSSFTISSIGNTTGVEYLIVGGGGAGGSNNNCGGGGAGGLIYNTASLSVGTYAVTVGQSGSVASGVSNGNNGGNSTFNGLVALGGGGGGGTLAGSNGGSGGGNGGGGFGGTNSGGGAGLQPTSSYGGFGNKGGFSAGASSYPGGGGGGAGAAGGNGSGATGGNGGIGKAYAFAGALTYYAGGGGGSLNPGTAGTGGLGGGGNGVSSNGVGANATGYGSGGGGGLNASGGAGSPGIILIKYRYTA